MVGVLMLLAFCSFPLILRGICEFGDWLEKKVMSSRFRDAYIKAGEDR